MELPSENILRWLVSRYASLRASHREAFAERPLIEPDARYFPDAFVGDASSVAKLLRRMVGYSPLADDLGLEVALVGDDDEACGTGGCHSGGNCCGGGGDGGAHGGGGVISRIVEHDDRYRVEVAVDIVTNPVVLGATLARLVGTLVLAEAGEQVGRSEEGAMGELAATASGLGMLLLNGAAVFRKGCGGVRVERATELGVGELGVVLALFVRVHGAKPAVVRRHLEATQSEAFDLGLRWTDSNRTLVEQLSKAPELLEGGAFTVEPIRGIFARLFGGSSKPEVEAAPRKERTEAERRRIAETKALVEDALRGDP
jgi:hypothetical protein